jgi:hypothetical protein
MNASTSIIFYPSNGATKPSENLFLYPYDFGRLLGKGFIRKNPDPYLTLTLHITGNGNTGRFNLLAGDPFVFQSLYSKRTKGQLVTAWAFPSCGLFVVF